MKAEVKFYQNDLNYAFPQYEMGKSSIDGGPVLLVRGGMKLRDYFAAAAFAAVVLHDYRNHDAVAADCYKLADAMLKAREKK